MILFAEKLSGHPRKEAIQLLSLLERTHYYMDEQQETDKTASRPGKQHWLSRPRMANQAAEAVKKSLRHEDRAIQLKTVQVLVTTAVFLWFQAAFAGSRNGRTQYRRLLPETNGSLAKTTAAGHRAKLPTRSHMTIATLCGTHLCLFLRHSLCRTCWTTTP
jgi:hypothetical protein